MYPFTALVALALDATWGYPSWVFAAVGHPVSWMGRLIARCEVRWNEPRWSFSRRRLHGAIALFVVLAVTAAACITLTAVINKVVPAPFNLLLIGAAASTLIAQRSLYDHVAAVAAALEGPGLAEARRTVGLIVGRDTDGLDEAGVARAAIESLAENYSDGVVAPLFWLLVGGLPAAAIYKAINTADSMIGHKSERYRAYGWAAARLDDLVNLPASRLAALFIIAAASALPDANAREAMHAVGRDARHHRSPNAGWPEAAMAGSLGVRLAGPRSYGGTPVRDHWMGDGRDAADAADVRRALAVYRTACIMQSIAVAAIGCLAIACGAT
ncbi:MAG: adenosylcobinamide-phosphate synthase CbiB [Hyphomicrobium sp.]